MNHDYDITQETRLERAKTAPYNVPFVPSLKAAMEAEFGSDTSLWRWHDPQTYAPTKHTDSFEAALLAAAWKANSNPLVLRFGTDGLGELFDRFAAYGLRNCDSLLTGKPLRLYRGTTKPELAKRHPTMTWTRDKATAVKFALNSGSTPRILLSTEVMPESVLMALADDPEFEVVIRSGAVLSVSIEPVAVPADYVPTNGSATSY